jgi:hypothetical protein
MKDEGHGNSCPIGPREDSEWGKKPKDYAGVVVYFRPLERENPRAETMELNPDSVFDRRMKRTEPVGRHEFPREGQVKP